MRPPDLFSHFFKDNLEDPIFNYTKHNSQQCITRRHSRQLSPRKNVRSSLARSHAQKKNPPKTSQKIRKLYTLTGIRLGRVAREELPGAVGALLGRPGGPERPTGRQGHHLGRQGRARLILDADLAEPLGGQGRGRGRRTAAGALLVVLVGVALVERLMAARQIGHVGAAAAAAAARVARRAGLAVDRGGRRQGHRVGRHEAGQVGRVRVVDGPGRGRRVRVRRQGIGRGRPGRGDGRAGQTALELVEVAGQHAEDVVQDVTGAGATLAEVGFGEQAEGLAVHLEHVHVELGQVELALGPAEEGRDVLARPESRV